MSFSSPSLILHSQCIKEPERNDVSGLEFLQDGGSSSIYWKAASELHCKKITFLIRKGLG